MIKSERRLTNESSERLSQEQQSTFPPTLQHLLPLLNTKIDEQTPMSSQKKRTSPRRQDRESHSELRYIRLRKGGEELRFESGESIRMRRERGRDEFVNLVRSLS